MNTYSRLASTAAAAAPSTNASVWHEKQWSNFQTAALAPPDGLTHYGLWNASQGLFYRDSRFVGTSIFWGRGNGWAIGALVAAIANGGTDPHLQDYIAIYKQLAETLKRLAEQEADGAWRPSLLHPADYPLAETTATAGFVHGLAFGINHGLLAKADYLPAVAKAWAWLAAVALQPATGRLRFCQPGGGSPESNFNGTSPSSSYCVGDFLLAVSQVARLETAV